MEPDVLERLTDVLTELAEVMTALKDRFNGRDITATVDGRGRLTIKEDDRKALGIDGDRALLDLHVQVLEKDVEPKRSDGGQTRD